MQRHLAAAFLALAVAAPGACSDKEEGLLPVGGGEASTVAQAHFVRRLHLDLSGAPPTDEASAAALARLESEGSTAKTRGALAKALIDAPEFASLFVSEIENRVFGGASLDGEYDLVCALLRDDPTCATCSSPEPCACDCSILPSLSAERDALHAAAGGLAAKERTTSEVERLFASSQVIRILGSPESTAATIWENFLGRTPEPDESRNAQLLVMGAIFPGTPAGLLFHRHGASFDDLIDIVFDSEAYREAAVIAVFLRYLGRPPTPIELAAFTASLDPEAPDVRGVIESVVSSREYFDQ